MAINGDNGFLQNSSDISSILCASPVSARGLSFTHELLSSYFS